MECLSLRAFSLEGSANGFRAWFDRTSAAFLNAPEADVLTVLRVMEDGPSALAWQITIGEALLEHRHDGDGVDERSVRGLRIRASKLRFDRTSAVFFAAQGDILTLTVLEVLGGSAHYAPSADCK